MSKNTRLSIVIAISAIVLAIASLARADETTTLKTLKRLPKPLLSWSPAKFASNNEMEAFTDVSGSCPVSVRWSSDAHTRSCVQFVSADTRNLLALSYSPMVRDLRGIERQFKGDGPRIILEKQRLSMDLAGPWEVEMNFVRAKLQIILAMVIERGVDPGNVVLMLDHEYAVMNDLTRPAITFKLDQIYDMAKDMGFQVFHYNIHSIRFDRRAEGGWSEWTAVPPACKSDYASTSLYHVVELMHMRMTMQKTLENTELDAVPFISLGWRWEQGYDSGRITRRAGPPYSVDTTSILSDNLHKAWKVKRIDLYFDNRRVPMVWTYPGVGHSPQFFPHFYAYHRGAVKGSKAPR